MVYCAVEPSSLLAGPVTDHSPGPSAAPAGPWVSLIVVVTLAAAGSTPMVSPVVLAALVKPIV